jgi:trimeric autotransporter adhesin
VHGEELWSTDGTVKGTKMVTDIVSIPLAQDQMGDPVAFKENLYFARDHTIHGNELWRVDSTGVNPRVVKNIAE